jgi:hypothetical protein
VHVRKGYGLIYDINAVFSCGDRRGLRILGLSPG